MIDALILVAIFLIGAISDQRNLTAKLAAARSLQHRGS